MVIFASFGQSWRPNFFAKISALILTDAFYAVYRAIK